MVLHHLVWLFLGRPEDVAIGFVTLIAACSLTVVKMIAAAGADQYCVISD